ncbi:MAG: histone deacetylase family protein, partial [Candidatus Hydrogenedentota bacterium]
MAKTALVYREETLAHDTGPGHPERPDRLRAIMRGFRETGLDPPRLEVEPAQREDLLRVHTAEHLGAVERACAAAAVYPDPDTPMGAGSWDAALLASGGLIAACGAVLDGSVDRVFCVTRPPGHHAERRRAMGFCLFNHVAVAARWLHSVRGVERVAILDWDVHHGNGTQDATFDDPAIYYA